MISPEIVVNFTNSFFYIFSILYCDNNFNMGLELTEHIGNSYIGKRKTIIAIDFS